MARKGPPKYFENKPSKPVKVPVPRMRGGKPHGQPGKKGEGGSRARRGASAEGKSRVSWFGSGGESWKTYLVVIGGTALLIVIMVSYFSKSFKYLDMRTATEELALLAATMQVIMEDQGGLEVAETARGDDSMLQILRDVAAGGAVVRDESGRIMGSTPPESGVAPRFRSRVPDQSILRQPFHFVFSGTGGGEIAEKGSGGTRYPSIAVEGFGVLHSPDDTGRWVFEGDFSHVPREFVMGGEEFTANLPTGTGEPKIVRIFHPAAESSGS